VQYIAHRERLVSFVNLRRFDLGRNPNLFAEIPVSEDSYLTASWVPRMLFKQFLALPDRSLE
jgi:hypothetical protein